MAIRLHLDEDGATTALVAEPRRLGFHAVSTDQAGSRGKPDAQHLGYAARQSHVLGTANASDSIPVHFEWLGSDRHHGGIIAVAQEIVLGERIRRLAEICEIGEPGDLDDRLLILTQWT